MSDYSDAVRAAIRATFAQTLAGDGVTADDVVLTIVSGSVSISAAIAVPADSASAAVTTLSTGIMSSPSALSTALTSVGGSALSSITVAAITATPQIAASPSPPPPSTSGAGYFDPNSLALTNSDGDDSSSVIMIAAAGGGVALIASLVFVTVCICRQKRRAVKNVAIDKPGVQMAGVSPADAAAIVSTSNASVSGVGSIELEQMSDIADASETKV